MKRLSKRQTQVLQYAAEGFVTKETAVALSIAYHTARNHRVCAMRKLKAKTITHAVAIALRGGMIK